MSNISFEIVSLSKAYPIVDKSMATKNFFFFFFFFPETMANSLGSSHVPNSLHSESKLPPWTFSNSLLLHFISLPNSTNPNFLINVCGFLSSPHRLLPPSTGAIQDSSSVPSHHPPFQPKNLPTRFRWRPRVNLERRGLIGMHNGTRLCRFVTSTRECRMAKR